VATPGVTRRYLSTAPNEWRSLARLADDDGGRREAFDQLALRSLNQCLHWRRSGCWRGHRFWYLVEMFIGGCLGTPKRE
jgi:hypothetical protein